MSDLNDKNTTSIPQAVSAKRNIVKVVEYKAINDFIDQHPGLAIDCTIELVKHFPQIEILTLKSILENVFTNRLRSQYWRIDENAAKFHKMYEKQCQTPSPQNTNNCILLDMARSEDIDPVPMCRALLKAKYKDLSKNALNSMLLSPHTIDDSQLAANVAQCICSDAQNGPLVDFKRRFLGQEYEFKLKQLATAAGMHFYDENDLRRLGYDKTPDLKLILPVLYKGEVINWIESKANFVDIKTHKTYVHKQLNSYCNRFGAGIVIYWFGYMEGTESIPENNLGIIVLNDFPAKTDIKVMDLSECDDSYPPDNYDDRAHSQAEAC